MGNTERLSSLNGLRQVPKEQEEESAMNLKVPKNDDKKVSKQRMKLIHFLLSYWNNSKSDDDKNKSLIDANFELQSLFNFLETSREIQEKF